MQVAKNVNVYGMALETILGAFSCVLGLFLIVILYFTLLYHLEFWTETKG
jgi:hypothetical protein